MDTLGDTKPAPEEVQEYAKRQGLNPDLLHLRFGPRGIWEYVYGDNRHFERCRAERDWSKWVDELGNRHRHWEAQQQQTVQHTAAPRPQRATQRARGRSREAGRGQAAVGASGGRRRSSRGDPDRESDPPLTRACRGCGCEFEARRPNQWYHDPRCKSRASTAKHRATQRTAEPLDLYRRSILAARRTGALADDEALVLLARDESEAFGELLLCARNREQRERIAQHFGVAS
jgi:hypothetical protein